MTAVKTNTRSPLPPGVIDRSRPKAEAIAAAAQALAKPKKPRAKKSKQAV